MAAWCSVALGVAVAPATARANPVNAEVLRPNPLRDGWSGGFDWTLALSSGNVELLDLGGAARVQFQTLRPQPARAAGAPAALPFVHQRMLLAGNGRFAERTGSKIVNQAFVHARWTAMWHERIGSDVFAQYQFNEFQRLQGRAIAGLGARFELIHEAAFMAWAGSGYMFEYDRIEVLPGAPDAPEFSEHRWTTYATLRLATFDGQLLLQNTVYYQPRLDDLADLRMLEELEVIAKVGERFGLGATLSVLHDTAPPTGVRRTDLRLLNTIRVSF